ncbi:hypothetical protein KO525_12075 [Psychrosphaera sp. B3R10]|uniref:Uncharacterized protein n=1 Tax=Psychrosphaera algicola TaxID=3023714 RepID=A0ABT5FJB4_9GAMM|nr:MULTISPECIES: hypothetical protein [unclassified Psychrosphaera]MBU2883922.1 hypothetical protein [Psychrosphaera sp. I2R16]MBU2990117.1 hypothetical protein [Psychrosphaera sp. B3R10]MDC2891235.1 hypothetical protein [Psychrosphaera sp. G1-22]MDO6719893.1 hypothetical protein [Psychrosphaera sp. 1_MG-2023]
MESLLRNIQYGLMDYIEGDDDPDYNVEDVDACIKLLIDFHHLVQSKGRNLDEALVLVRDLVLALNDLNLKCDECLIETDQREQICEFIFRVLDDANILFDGDVTEEWRAW